LTISLWIRPRTCTHYIANDSCAYEYSLKHTSTSFKKRHVTCLCFVFLIVFFFPFFIFYSQSFNLNSWGQKGHEKCLDGTWTTHDPLTVYFNHSDWRKWAKYVTLVVECSILVKLVVHGGFLQKLVVHRGKR